MSAGQQFGTTLAPDWKQWEGQLVDGAFPLKRYVGGSGTSAVFLTDYEGHSAAIQLVAAASQDAEARLSRWQSASELSHPHLIRLFGFGHCQLGETSAVYVVMEWAEENLAQVLPQRQLTTEEVREMLPPALSALAYLHREGFVHGHLKPANILAVKDQLKISTDGLQQISEESSTCSDVYALATLLAQASETLPEPFRTIVDHGLDPNPESRWTIPQIEAYLRHPPASQPKWTATGWRTGVALAALGLIVLVSVVVYRGENNRPEAVVAPVAQPVTQPEPPPAAASSATPEVVSQILPDVPQQARSTIQGSVRSSVRIKIDPSGDVTDAKIETQGPSPYFASLALKAARRWKFQPMSAAEEGIVRFEFLKSDTKASFRPIPPNR